MREGPTRRLRVRKGYSPAECGGIPPEEFPACIFVPRIDICARSAYSAPRASPPPPPRAIIEITLCYVCLERNKRWFFSPRRLLPAKCISVLGECDMIVSSPKSELFSRAAVFGGVSLVPSLVSICPSSPLLSLLRWLSFGAQGSKGRHIFRTVRGARPPVRPPARFLLVTTN